AGAQTRRLRACHEQGSGGLLIPPGRAAGQRCDQVELSRHLTRRPVRSPVSPREVSVRLLDIKANPRPTGATQHHQGVEDMSIKPRTVLKGMLASSASVAVLKAPAVHAQAAPFKLGLLTVKTGPLAQGGIQMEQGVVTFLKEKNNT